MGALFTATYPAMVERLVLFAAMAWQRRLAWPAVWWPVLVTGFFQTTVNFGATTMAVAAAGATTRADRGYRKAEGRRVALYA